jgi:hypothetical protein
MMALLSRNILVIIHMWRMLCLIMVICNIGSIGMKNKNTTVRTVQKSNRKIIEATFFKIMVTELPELVPLWLIVSLV